MILRNRTIRRIKRTLAAVMLMALVAAFLGVRECAWAPRLQAVPALIALDVFGIAALLAMTVLYGRLYCECFCPLGIAQCFVNWLFRPKRHVRRVCTRLPETSRQRKFRWTVFGLWCAFVLSGLGGLAYLIEPYSLFGKALTLSTVGIVAVGAVLVLSAVGLGRIWCNWVCPVGTVLALLARIAPFGNSVGRQCVNCRKCFTADAGDDDDSAASHEKPAEDGVGRREVLKGVVAVVAAEKLTDGGYAPVSLPGSPERERIVLPPGAGRGRVFRMRCVGCQRCVKSCPENCLRPSTGLKTFGQPEMDFRHGYCRLNCTTCGSVCPTGALPVLADRVMRRSVHMGLATWRKDLCVRQTNGDKCTACERKCPVEAIRLVGDAVTVDADLCVGCGACEHVCPARPMPAIFVKGYADQRIVRPMGDADLLAEMRRLLEKGSSVVVAYGGVIVARGVGHGVEPLLRLYRNRTLSGAIVYDRVIGRAAAAVCVAGRARSVRALLMSEDAADYLRRHGVSFHADRTVPRILNKDQTDRCPFELAVEGVDDPGEIVKALQSR